MGMHHRDEDEEDDGARGGALVEEAKRLMGEDQDEMTAQPEASGPKIKMGRLGKRGKKPAPGKESKADVAKADDRSAPSKGLGLTTGGSGPSGGFTEKDIEFMKKAIQVLC